MRWLVGPVLFLTLAGCPSEDAAETPLLDTATATATATDTDPEPGSADTSATSCGGTPITEVEYEEAFFATMCVHTESCNPAFDAWCDEPTTTYDTTASPCTFHAEPACDCLEGEYTCNTDLPGFEFVEAPPACMLVYTCG